MSKSEQRPPRQPLLPQACGGTLLREPAKAPRPGSSDQQRPPLLQSSEPGRHGSHEPAMKKVTKLSSRTSSSWAPSSAGRQGDASVPGPRPSPRTGRHPRLSPPKPARARARAKAGEELEPRTFEDLGEDVRGDLLPPRQGLPAALDPVLANLAEQADALPDLLQLLPPPWQELDERPAQEVPSTRCPSRPAPRGLQEPAQHWQARRKGGGQPGSRRRGEPQLSGGRGRQASSRSVVRVNSLV